jgi:glycosyltransferase involved in cell wall biosynthesis
VPTASDTLSPMPGGRGDQPLVSVGLPVFNEEESLAAALESILAQDYEPLEVIVCDNASTDGTVTVARDFVARDTRVSVHTSDENRGASENFNRCFRLAGGRYFTWASGHDARLPEAIRKCVEALEDDPSLVLCYPRAVRRLLDGGTEPIEDDRVETRGLPTASRLRMTVEELHSANAIHGVVRSASLERTRLFQGCFGPDHVLLAELSVLGGFHQLDEALFVRVENRAEEQDDEWRERNLDMIGVDSELARARPFTAMGFELVAGVWHVSEPWAKVPNAARASRWFRDRWHGRLNEEARAWRALDTVVDEVARFRIRFRHRVGRLLA